MTFSVKTVTRTYTPSEAAKITGVSPALQRDWRRRELLPETKKEGWANFSLDNIIEMSVMKAFSDGGISVLAAREMASTAVLPTLRNIVHKDEAVSFEGDVFPAQLKEHSITGFIRGGDGDYLFAPLPVVSGTPEVYRFASPADIEKTLETGSSFYGIIIDTINLADKIISNSELPLIRFEVEEKE